MTPALAASFIAVPRSFIDVAVQIVLSSLSVPHVVLHCSFEVLAVSEQDLDLSINHPVPFKLSLNQFVRVAEQSSCAHGFAVTPLAFEDGPICEQAYANAMPHIVLPHSFVPLARWELNLAHAMSKAFLDRPLIDKVSHLLHLIVSLLKEGVPVARHLGAEKWVDFEC